MSAAHDDGCSDHRALLYADGNRFVRSVGSFLREGLRDSEHVMAAVAPEKAAWLREDLGPDADAVDITDATELYRRHGPMFSAVLEYVERHAARGAGRVRIVAEHPLTGRAPADVRDYMRYEAAINVALRGHAASILCPYDAQRLPEAILQDAMRTHPEIVEHDHPQHSALFTDPRVFVRERVGVPAVPPGAPTQALDRPEDVARVRELVRAQAGIAGLPGEAVEDAALAVTEVASNALLHGSAPRAVWSYVEGDTLICRIRDAGSGLPDPLAGYLPPDFRNLSGRGLWLAHQLCDVVEVVSDGTGTDVHLQMRGPGAA